jgi:hypothetical protein
MTQFIAHADAPRTFADKKGATKAIKRDLEKTSTDLNVTGYDVKEAMEGRFGVVVYVDLTPTEAQKLVGKELEGYVIEPSLQEPVKPEPVKADKPTKPTKADKAPKAPATGARRKGQITVAPTAPLIACRPGSKQQAIIETLAREGGATLSDLRKVCLKADGTPWDDNSIRSAMYYDLEQKGYGTDTRFEDDVAIYSLVLPKGYTTFLPPKAKS